MRATDCKRIGRRIWRWWPILIPVVGFLVWRYNTNTGIVVAKFERSDQERRVGIISVQIFTDRVIYLKAFACDHPTVPSGFQFQLLQGDGRFQQPIQRHGRYEINFSYSKRAPSVALLNCDPWSEEEKYSTLERAANLPTF